MTFMLNEVTTASRWRQLRNISIRLRNESRQSFCVLWIIMYF